MQGTDKNNPFFSSFRLIFFSPPHTDILDNELLLCLSAVLNGGSGFSIFLLMLLLHSDDPSKAQELSCEMQPFCHLDVLLRPTLLLFAPTNQLLVQNLEAKLCLS